jgi:hypothetical protein
MASRQSPSGADLPRLSECVDRTIDHANQTPGYGQSRIRSLEWIAKVLRYLKRRRLSRTMVRISHAQLAQTACDNTSRCDTRACVMRLDRKRECGRQRHRRIGGMKARHASMH